MSVPTSYGCTTSLEGLAGGEFSYTYAVLVGGANGDLDLLELIDGRSYTLQCRSACRTRQAEKCMGEGLSTQRS